MGLVVAGLGISALAASAERTRTLAPPASPRAPGQDAGPPPSANAYRLGRGEPMELGSATEADLELLPGIGPALARRIVEERDRSGGYARVEDLRRVRGIGPRTIERIGPLVRVGPRAPARTPDAGRPDG